MPQVDCPRCSQVFDIELSQLGTVVECPSCQTAFPAIENEPVADNLKKLNIYQLAEQDSPEQRRWIIAEAEETVRLPARGLIITGRIGIVIAAVMAVLFFGSFVLNVAEGRGWRAEELLLWSGFCLAIIPYQIAIVHGATQFHKLRSVGWSYAAAIMALLPILLTGPCGIISIPYAILGVMALFALSNWKVKQAIRWNRDAD